MQTNIEAAVKATKKIDDWKYGSDDHLQQLAQFGFSSTDEYEEAYAKQPCVIAYDKFNHIIRKTEGAAEKALIAELKQNNLWNEETGSEKGIELYAIAKKHNPKLAELIELMGELDLDWPTQWDRN